MGALNQASVKAIGTGGAAMPSSSACGRCEVPFEVCTGPADDRREEASEDGSEWPDCRCRVEREDPRKSGVGAVRLDQLVLGEGAYPWQRRAVEVEGEPRGLVPGDNRLDYRYAEHDRSPARSDATGLLAEVAAGVGEPREPCTPPPGSVATAKNTAAGGRAIWTATARR